MRPSLFRRNLALIAFAISAATLLFIALAIGVTDRISIASGSSILLKTAALASDSLPPIALEAAPNPEGKIELSEAVSRIAFLTGYRVTIIRGDGTVLADSVVDPAAMGNHATRPEIARAMEGEPSTSARRSATTSERLLYAAIPLGSRGSNVLRLAMTLPPAFSRLGEAQWIFILFLLFVAALSLIISVAINRQIALPIGYLLDKAEAYAKNAPSPIVRNSPLPVELRMLDESLDDMVEKIRQRSKDAEELGKRYASILEAAGEGVIAVDASLKILEANSAAAELFGVAKADMPGKTILEALGNREIADIFRESFEESKELFRDLRLIRNGERHVKVHTTISLKGRQAGIVAVFSDITELKRLEAVRKDFVANVSHELRTPIQIVRGYAELLQGEEIGSESAKKYLALIDKNAQRMERIVSDLLSLARLENDPSSWLTIESCDLGATLEGAMAAVESRAAAKSIEISLQCPAGLYVMANSGLIEQAIVNLLDNAINYSPEGSAIVLSALAAAEGEAIEISVSDKGIGIPPADLIHIFERFYRVDKSRSKLTGGTGLGLAIVRHIATIHGGTVRAESYKGEGSKFTITLPRQGPRGFGPREG